MQDVAVLIVGGGNSELTDPEGQWAEAYGLDETGAVLVRPDGYVGWRSPAMTADPRASLGDAMASIMGLTAASSS
jgi:putative polyketide hydroxylase